MGQNGLVTEITNPRTLLNDYLLPSALAPSKILQKSPSPLRLVSLHVPLSNALREERKAIRETCIMRNDNHDLG